MRKQTVLLINCSRPEAEQIRERAKRQRRTISGYVLNLVSKAVRINKNLDWLKSLGSSVHIRPRDLDLFSELEGCSRRLREPRTTMLLSCTVEEAREIRETAKMKAMTISGLVLGALRHSWDLNEMAISSGRQVLLHAKGTLERPGKSKERF
jgi:hypothetical protein